MFPHPLPIGQPGVCVGVVALAGPGMMDGWKFGRRLRIRNQNALLQDNLVFLRNEPISFLLVQRYFKMQRKRPHLPAA